MLDYIRIVCPSYTLHESGHHMPYACWHTLRLLCTLSLVMYHVINCIECCVPVGTRQYIYNILAIQCSGLGHCASPPWMCYPKASIIQLRSIMGVLRKGILTAQPRYTDSYIHVLSTAPQQLLSAKHCKKVLMWHCLSNSWLHIYKGEPLVNIWFIGHCKFSHLADS